MLRPLIPLLFTCLFFVLPPASARSEVRAVAVQQASTTYQGIVNTTANIRSGPGLSYSVVGQAQAGQAITVVACNEDCSWLEMENGNWIAAFLVDLVGESSSPTGSATDNTPGNNSGNNNGRTRSRGVDADDLELTEPSQAALEIVEQILSYTGLPQTFDVYSANIYNAAALMANGKRVIVYDPQLIADIENITKHDWPAVSIFAHEIGHHLAGHTLAEAYNRQFELEADYFSGYILYKMGSTLDQSQAVMNLLRDHANMTDHPPQAERLTAIERGWQEAARQEELAIWEAPLSNFEEEAAQASYTQTSEALPSESTLFSLLQRAHNAGEGLDREAKISAVREWGLGLRGWVGDRSTE